MQRDEEQLQASRPPPRVVARPCRRPAAICAAAHPRRCRTAVGGHLFSCSPHVGTVDAHLCRRLSCSPSSCRRSWNTISWRNPSVVTSHGAALLFSVWACLRCFSSRCIWIRGRGLLAKQELAGESSICLGSRRSSRGICLCLLLRRNRREAREIRFFLF
ncbi:hypothetical protein GQ55_5G236500 [Panicum hallii var. hallii]|uniref:Uncharacterized protein n=1 Tax=Panicum hallii var. hallii TaxID=1504633 RepID=A0A2T7DJI2_9POAL|nr:hypothetical protein GQ55_5G236500 [Panicum hallii var. hallii]